MPQLRPISELIAARPQPVPAPKPAPGPQPTTLPATLPKPTLSGLPKPAVQPAKPAASLGQLWGLQATMRVLSADKNFDGKLDGEEYKKVALVQGDGYFATRARDYEFAVVDEIKLVDGGVSMSELAEFYQSMDSDSNGSHSDAEFENRMNQSNWITRIRNPIASFTHLMSPYTRLIKSSLGF